MAKAPLAGRSKTRLSPPLLPDQCAELSAAFLQDTMENLAMAATEAAIVPYAAYAPQGSEALLRPLIGENAKLLLADGSAAMPEGVTGFGRCLLQATQDMLRQGHLAACVLSSDIPTLPTRLLVEAAESLIRPGDHAVLGATEDGGYYLLGVKAAHAHLFRGIDWSTSRVAEQTRARAREIGLTLIELDSWYDVDDAASLNILLAEQKGYAAIRTKAVIARLHLDHLARPQAAAPTP